MSISTPHPNPLPDRCGEGEASDAPATASEYVDASPLLRKLERLKNEVRSCGRPVRDYPCEWTGSGFTGLEEFGRRVFDDLWSGVLRDERYVSKDVRRQVLGSPLAQRIYFGVWLSLWLER